MSETSSYKNEILSTFHAKLDSEVQRISLRKDSREEKSKAVNSLIAIIRDDLFEGAIHLPIDQKAGFAIVLQYCFSVVSLEYRHRVWPYEYMAFSRRIGELWESFCSISWDFPSRNGCARMEAPSFSTVMTALYKRVLENIGDHERKEIILEDINTLIELVGDINMKEDETFYADDIPYVVDFKSGFGSNEKGNMMRLQTVGKAYRMWNPDTRLMLLVRQDENNNYLEVLRRAGLWEVYTGTKAYEQIELLTGSAINSIRSEIIDWEKDLSSSFYQFLKNQSTDLTSYLIW